jgi:nucleoside-diphosphate-sugar epimerase
MLLSRGHEVEVVTTADRAPALEAYPVHWASRSLPRGVRHARAVQLIAAAARRADVVYSTGCSAAARWARRSCTRRSSRS